MSKPIKTYEAFYKEHGVRTSGMLVSPPIAPMSDLTLPRNSAYHWYGYDHSDQVGLAQDDPIAVGVKRYIFATNIEKYVQEDIIGDPYDVPLITSDMTKSYFSDNSKIKRMPGGIESIRDDQSLVVYNYGLLNDHYRYVGITSSLDRWLNYHRTVYKNIAREVVKSNRHHFVEFNVPEMIPPLSMLKRAEEGIDNNLMRQIKDPDSWGLAELYNLITVDYKAYIFKDIVEHPEVLAKVNLIVTCGSFFTVINLGRIIEFAGDAESSSTDSGRQRIANRFVKAMLSMRETLTLGAVGSDTTIGNAIAQVGNLANSEDDEDIIDEENAKAGQFNSTVSTKEDDEIDNEVIDVNLDPFADVRKSDTKQVAAKQITAVMDNDNDEEEDEDEVIDRIILEELNQLESTALKGVTVSDDEISAYKAYVPQDVKPEDKAVQHAQKYADIGLMTPSEVNRIKKIAAKVNEIPSPLKPGTTLVKSLEIKPGELDIDEGAELVSDKIIGVSDDSMRHSSLTVFDNKYITNTMQKDIGNMALAIQNAGIMVTDYKIERVANIKDEYLIYKIKVHPVGGTPSTISFKMPVVEEDGTYMASGSRYRTRKQRGDLPIRKVAPDEVALTSYYSKMFVNRTPRKQYNYSAWLVNTIIAASLSDAEDNTISSVMLNDVSDTTKVVPRAYSAVAIRISSFVGNGNTFYFDVNKIESNLGVAWNGKMPIPVGKNKAGALLYMDDSNNITVGAKGESLGRFSEVIGLNVTHRPVDFAETKIFSKTIPVGIILAYQLGLGTLIKTLKCKVKKLGRREAYRMQPDEWALYFSSHKLIFSENDKVATLILKGFSRVDKLTRKHELYDYDTQLSYNAVFDNLKVPVRYLKEIPLMFDMWVDPITRDILLEMGEPTDLVLLFLKACEMLLDDAHPQSTDVAFMRDKGYERHAGLMYGEIVRAVRTYHNKPLSATNKLEINPEVVWYAITKDPAHMILKEANPIHELKEQESVIYGGSGGRSTVSMTAKDRTFHKNSLGSTSEATVDNGDTGAVIYTTFNPSYKNVRGMTERIDITGELETSKLVSTSMLLAPAAENEDAKRTGFTSVQNSSSTFCIGYTSLPVRTGAERVIGARTSPLYNVTSKGDATVTKVTAKAITVTFKDGSTESHPLGRIFGTWDNKQMPHELITDLKQGDKVKTGETISYNKYYFERDPINKNHTSFKMGLLGRVAMIEGADGYEDSTAMSTKLSNVMETKVGHIRDILLTKDQSISGLVSVGDLVSPDTILCTILNEQSTSNIFDEEAIKSLEALSASTPKAKYKGIIEKIEVRYVPEIDAMSESLGEIVSNADRVLYRERAELGKLRVNGQVDAGYRIKSNSMTADSVIIRIYVTEDISMGVGDKLVVSNQLKATVGRVWSNDTHKVYTVDDNEEVDVFFSYQSVDNRIVNSPELIGTTSSLLVKLGELATEAYFGK